MSYSLDREIIQEALSIKKREGYMDDVLTHSDFTFALCSFIDEFKRSKNRFEIIKEEPLKELLDDSIKKEACVLAATVHKLATEWGLEVPEWVHDSFYKMPYPVFAHDTTNKEYQEFLIKDAPIEFASRNIFYSSRAIERV